MLIEILVILVIIAVALFIWRNLAGRRVYASQRPPPTRNACIATPRRPQDDRQFFLVPPGTARRARVARRLVTRI